jgi:hypothetical protein
LEIASAAGVTLEAINSGDAARASELIRGAFLAPSRALDALASARGLSRGEQAQMRTRLKALVEGVVGAA